MLEQGLDQVERNARHGEAAKTDGGAVGNVVHRLVGGEAVARVSPTSETSMSRPGLCRISHYVVAPHGSGVSFPIPVGGAMSESTPIRGLDGEQRQQVASKLWSAWREDRRAAAILTGIPGVGKTDRVVRDLLIRATDRGFLSIRIEVPPNSIDLDKQLSALLANETHSSGATGLAEAIAGKASFFAALRELLLNGALVVLDEFQRLLNLSGQPCEPFATDLHKIATRNPDRGCLWLVSSRRVDPGWTEPFHEALLDPPLDFDDCQRIVLTYIGREDAEQRFPRDRRDEIVLRLGKNPRVLRFLGTLLRSASLEALLPPSDDIPTVPADSELIEQIERNLLAKATQGLSESAHILLRHLTVPSGASATGARGGGRRAPWRYSAAFA